MRSRTRRVAHVLLALIVATAAWLPSLHLFYARPISASKLAARQLQIWLDPATRSAELAKMRSTNAEWDFMARSFLVWSMANVALRDPSKQTEALRAMDAIIDDTLAMERSRGMYVFLMPYAHAKRWVDDPPRSQFLDGEIALMLALRCLVADDPRYRAELRGRVALMELRMRRSPVLSAESYPDECWTFCNTVALAAIRVADQLEGTDHRTLFADWIAMAKQRLVDPQTGLLVSSYTHDGHHLDGPEGSSLWMAIHCLSLLDEAFAKDQYMRATRELRRTILGFGFAAEWPRSWQGAHDVDSGPVIPGLDVSAGSSGLAFVGAATMGDRAYLDSLTRTLRFAGFGIEDATTLRFAASNPLGDAVLLYAMTAGPAWDLLKRSAR